MRAALYQAISNTCWTYYIFLQSDAFSFEQPLLMVHSAWAQSDLLAAADSIEQTGPLLAELAGYVHQHAGARQDT